VFNPRSRSVCAANAIGCPPRFHPQPFKPTTSRSSGFKGLECRCPPVMPMASAVCAVRPATIPTTGLRVTTAIMRRPVCRVIVPRRSKRSALSRPRRTVPAATCRDAKFSGTAPLPTTGFANPGRPRAGALILRKPRRPRRLRHFDEMIGRPGWRTVGLTRRCTPSERSATIQPERDPAVSMP
jgi:hypothetical protein